MNKQGAPALTEVKSGKSYYVYLYVTVPHPHAARYVTRWWIQPGLDRNFHPLWHKSFGVTAGTTKFTVSNRATTTLDSMVLKERYKIVTQISANGVTQSRTTEFYVVR
mgnify:CR=1 FL=1